MKSRNKKKLKTRNVMLFVVSAFVIAYTVADIILGFMSVSVGYGIQLDSTLTDQVFDYAKWVVLSGASITVAKTIKGNTNSDETEEYAQPDPEVIGREDEEDHV